MLKTAIIGAGGIARRHCRALRELGVPIAGVYDVRPESARTLAEEFDSRAAGSFEEVLGQADMIHLFTPPSRRLEYALPAMRAGKHVFAEKPMAIRLDDARQMEDAARESGVLFMTAFTQRFREGARMLKNLFDSGELGEMVQIFCFRIGAGSGFNGKLSDSWRTDPNLVCGMSIESLSHDIDFMRFLAGDIRSVKADVKGTISVLPAFDNNSNSVLTFANGAIGSITSSWSSHIPFNIRGIIGTKGSAVLQGEDQWNFEVLRVKTENMPYERSEKIQDDFFNGPSYLEENRYFLECVRQGRAPECGAEAGRKALEVSLAILESARKGIAVNLSN